MTQRMRVRGNAKLAIVRLLLTLSALGAALVDTHKWS
jgi:hypothetical protein